ncbi:MAG: hypothetical protein LBE76_06615, partial [Nitrososphaerota archaeon]|nr:hypothetical protein [Nitrososphaerota archaeon]
MPSFQCPLEVFTDGNDDYVYVLPQCFVLGLIDYGQLIKIREHGRVVGREKIVVYGEPSLGDIEAIGVEIFNGVLCERLGRLVRKSE